jgi:hypothetical protein
MINELSKKALELEILQIDKMIEKVRDLNNDSLAIYDGIVDLDEYISSDMKAMWILKEVNGNGETSDGSWDLRFQLSDLKTDNGVLSGWAKTFNPIIYTTYGILNDKKWNEIPDTKQEPEIIDVLKKIAYINIKKTAGTSVASRKELVSFHIEYKEIIKKQIEVYNPNVIICGSTFSIIKDDLDLTNHKFKEMDYIHIYSNENRIIIDAYHPNNRVSGLDKETYSNSIIEAVRKWKKANK